MPSLASFTRPFTWGADVVTAVPLALAVVVTVRFTLAAGRRSQETRPAVGAEIRSAPMPEHDAGIVWAAPILAATGWELYCFANLPRAAHPTLSSLLDMLDATRARQDRRLCVVARSRLVPGDGVIDRHTTLIVWAVLGTGRRGMRTGGGAVKRSRSWSRHRRGTRDHVPGGAVSSSCWRGCGSDGTPSPADGLRSRVLNRRSPVGLAPCTRVALSRALGAVIEGVRLAPDMDDSTVSGIRSALLEHKVVWFRGQSLDARSLTAVASRFGTPTEAHPVEPSLEGHPEVLPLDSDEGARADVWHSDLTFQERPPLGAVLHALEIPPVGGDTIWADMTGAYQSLSGPLRGFVDTLTATHSANKAGGYFAGRDRTGGEAAGRTATDGHPTILWCGRIPRPVSAVSS